LSGVFDGELSEWYFANPQEYNVKDVTPNTGGEYGKYA